VYLKHILQECEFLMENSSDISFKDFVDDSVLERAFIRSLEIIGEAVKKLPLDLREHSVEKDCRNERCPNS